MANYTEQEAQDLWDARETSCKCYNPGQPKNESNFITYNFRSMISGASPVMVNSKQDGVSVTHSSSAGTIETNIKAYIETLEKIVIFSSNETQI